MFDDMNFLSSLCELSVTFVMNSSLEIVAAQQLLSVNIAPMVSARIFGCSTCGIAAAIIKSSSSSSSPPPVPFLIPAACSAPRREENMLLLFSL